jgi:autophagy-related protein 2
LGELINLFHFEESKLTLRHATIRGVSKILSSLQTRLSCLYCLALQVSGWSSVYQSLLQIWTPDIRANQMSDLVGGAAPVRSLMQVGSGVADLILLPIDQWQKDGRIVKGIQRGGTSFAKTTTLEAMKLGAKLATGTQVILEKAENALRSDTSQSQRGEILEEGQAVTQKRSRYAEQPVGAREGLFQAYNALAQDLGSAAQTILAIPMEVHENTGSNVSYIFCIVIKYNAVLRCVAIQGAGRTVIRAVPLAVVQTMMGVTNASRKTLQGIRNQLDPQVLQQLQDKYKTATDDT